MGTTGTVVTWWTEHYWDVSFPKTKTKTKKGKEGLDCEKVNIFTIRIEQYLIWIQEQLKK